MLTTLLILQVAAIFIIPLALYGAGRIAKLQKLNKQGVLKPMGFWYSFGTVFVASIIASLLNFGNSWVMLVIFLIAIFPGIHTFKPTTKQIFIVYGIMIVILAVLFAIYALAIQSVLKI